MTYQALYRVWRPQTFSDMVGQKAIVRTLRNQVRTGRVAHAYLFCGSRGTGKTSAAKIMARAVNCLDPRDGDPCGECVCCRDILSGASMDVVEMDAASNSRVEETRELLEKVDYPPQNGRFKVYIIDEVHMLSQSAFNALLKTLEEPPEYMVFILATTEPQKVPATILSRCQRYDFGRFTMEELVGRMKQAAQGAPVTDEAYALMAQSAEGGMRDALSLLDMCLSLGGEVTEDSVRLVLGAADRQILFDMADAVARSDAEAALMTADRLYRAGSDISVFLRDLGRHFRQLAVARICGGAALTDMSPERRAAIEGQADLFTPEKLLRVLDLVMRAESDTRWASSARSVLEICVLKACSPADEQDVSALLERIAELENRLRMIESGQTAVRAAPAPRGAGQARQERESPVPPPPAVPASEAEIWKNTVKKLKTENAALSYIGKGRFEGVKDGAYCVTFAPQDSIYLALLSEDARKRVVEALRACGAEDPKFTAGLQEDVEKRRQAERAQTSMERLTETFGRENIQVSE